MEKNKNENLPEITTGKLATDLALLTEEEKKKYLQLAKDIDTHDVNSIQNYGNELSRIVSSNGDSLLQITQSNHTNTDDAVGYVTDLLSEVNDCNICIMKQCSGPASMKFTLTEADCENIGIEFEAGLEVYPVNIGWVKYQQSKNKTNKESQIRKANAMNNLDNSDVNWYCYGPNGRLKK